MPTKASLISELLLQKRSWTAKSPGEDFMNRDLYELLKAEILEGSLPGETQLPPTRQLSRELRVSRNTVVQAYDQLLAEGYVHATTGRGTFVAEVPHYRARVDVESADAPAPGAPRLSVRGAQLLRGHGASNHQWGAFTAGVPDVSLFPHAVWQRLLARHWRRPSPQALTYSTSGGHSELRRALAQHLRVSRSVRCEPEQIVITSGIHQAVDLVVRLLGDVGDWAWVEDPGYWGIRSVLAINGIRMRPVPVDAQGMAPDESLLASKTHPRFIFTTPSHHYPLGTVMSLQRRLALIEYARRTGCWLVEDDYDSEFRFEGRPLASLQGLDAHGRVIYTGTFSKTLFPGLRIGFMVLPPALAEPAAVALSELFREGQLLQQAVLADFIAEGHYASHLRRMRQVYAQRHALLRHAIARHFGEDWPVASREAGLHLVLGLPDAFDDQELSETLLTQGIVVRPLSRYFHEARSARKGLLLGYACVEDDAIEPAVARVWQAVRTRLARRPRTA